MPSVTIPTVIQIGTRSAFKNDQQYEYRWEEKHNIFMCGQTTAAGLPGEILVIMIEESATSNWYVAVEGRLDAGFEGRRPAFRTQEKFWRAGWHEWQVNRSNSGGDVDWDTRDHSCLYAETKVPGDAGTVDLLEGLQQLALTD